MDYRTEPLDGPVSRDAQWAQGRVVIELPEDVPIGAEIPDSNILCGHCGCALAIQMLPGQFIETVFICPECRRPSLNQPSPEEIDRVEKLNAALRRAVTVASGMDHGAARVVLAGDVQTLLGRPVPEEWVRRASQGRVRLLKIWNPANPEKADPKS